MTQHVRITDHAGTGGRCGPGYHLRSIATCSCGWRVEVSWEGNTCNCIPEHTADGLHAADTRANRLITRHIRDANTPSDGQGVLL